MQLGQLNICAKNEQKLTTVYRNVCSQRIKLYTISLRNRHIVVWANVYRPSWEKNDNKQHAIKYQTSERRKVGRNKCAVPVYLGSGNGIGVVIILILGARDYLLPDTTTKEQWHQQVNNWLIIDIHQWVTSQWKDQWPIYLSFMSMIIHWC